MHSALKLKIYNVFNKRVTKISERLLYYQYLNFLTTQNANYFKRGQIDFSS